MFYDNFDLNHEDAYSGYGSGSDSDVQVLLKALEAQEGITDISTLTSVGALQPQSLEGTLALLTHQEKHMTLWRDIPKGAAYSTLEEYSVQTGYGQEGGWVGQMESPLEGDPTAKRKFTEVKFLRDMWKISDVSGVVTTIKDSEVWAKQAASMRLLRRINATLYSGDSSMVAEQIDGFEKTIVNNGSSDHVKDLRGLAPSQQDFRELAELITANFGTVQGAGLYCSPGGMTTIDNILEAGTGLGANGAQRFIQGQVGPDGGISIGSGVKNIHTSFGTIIPKVDLFLAGEYDGRIVPKKANPSDPELLIEGATSVRAPLTPTFALVVNAPTVLNSKWGSGVRPASGSETYEYRVAAGNRFGLSAAAVAQAAGAITAAGSINVNITPDTNSVYPATYFEIYSEQVDASGVHYFVSRIVANGSSTVSFVDLNANIPGTTKMFLLDLTSVGELRTFMLKRLAPLHSKEYARIGEYRWGTVNMYVTPTFYAPRRYAMLNNVAIGVNSKSNLLNV